MERQRFVYLRTGASVLILSLIAFIIYAFNYKYKETIFLNGRVTSGNQSLLLKSPITAKIEKINVSNNQDVHKDRVIAEFDCKKIQQNLDKVVYDLKAVKNYISLNNKEILNQEKLSKINISMLSDYSNIFEDLAIKGAVSELQSKDYSSKLKSAQIESEQRVSALRRRSLELEQSKNSLETDVFQARDDFNNCKFKTPSSGIISEVFVRPQELVGKGTPMFRVFVPTSTRVSFELPSQFVESVEVGSAFDVRVSAYPYQKYGVLNAVVESISPVTADMIEDNENPLNINRNNSSRSGFLVQAMILNSLEPISTDSPTPNLKNGMPITALFQSTDKKLIYILSDQFVKLQNSIESMRSRF